MSAPDNISESARPLPDIVLLKEDGTGTEEVRPIPEPAPPMLMLDVPNLDGAS